MRKFNLFVLAVFVSCVSTAFAQDGGMSEEEMMKRWMEFATPKAEHAELAKLAGDWSASMKMWMGPNETPTVSTAEVKNEMTFDGRVLTSHYHGEMMGAPFHGMGQFGYATFTKSYWLTWMDNMSTALTYAEGSSSDGGKTIVMNGLMDEPIMGVQDKPVRWIHKAVNEDQYIFEAWDEIGTPHEFKAMEITYTRKK